MHRCFQLANAPELTTLAQHVLMGYIAYCTKKLAGWLDKHDMDDNQMFSTDNMQFDKWVETNPAKVCWFPLDGKQRAIKCGIKAQ